MQTEEGWAGVVRNTPLPRADDHLLSRKQLDTERSVPQTQDSGESCGYKKLAKVIIFLAHNLMGLKQEVNDLKQQITAVAHKEPSKMELQEEINRFKKALTAAEQQEHLEKVARNDLERKHPHKITIKAANSELLDKVARTETLIQQLNNTQDKLDMFRRELRDSYRLRKETQWERHPTPASSLSSANSPRCTKLRRGEPTLSA
ncbi:uncharacterized protein LOC107728147 [Sinocyclocheilus rhinocerous]|uniref:uncharacterized protein LOC107728147 n=1 Tax=Sinocyclocheilus rhinocerous TaxID=307959 RepID=UPI0007B7D61A|nr:PREDICTED: uncharacterized protein LOC107728147 [Sinocyclocheilus rhinocerous]